MNDGADLAGVRILIVEDEFLIARELEILVQQRGGCDRAVQLAVVHGLVDSQRVAQCRLVRLLAGVARYQYERHAARLQGRRDGRDVFTPQINVKERNVRLLSI